MLKEKNPVEIRQHLLESLPEIRDYNYAKAKELAEITLNSGGKMLVYVAGIRRRGFGELDNGPCWTELAYGNHISSEENVSLKIEGTINIESIADYAPLMDKRKIIDVVLGA